MLDPRYLRLALLAAQDRAKREPAPKPADERDAAAPKPAETPAA